MRELPADADEPAIRLVSLYRQIRGTYDAAGLDEDVMLGVDWSAVRIGFPPMVTWRALCRLRDPNVYGVLVKTGSAKLKTGKVVDLYTHVPGGERLAA